jgi:type IV secretion system protein VirB5
MPQSERGSLSVNIKERAMLFAGKRALVMFVLCVAGIPVAHGQFAVIDVASVTQLISQVKTLEQQLATAQADLAQAQAAYQATVGGRGMERLLSGTVRNYLPSDWNSFLQTAQGANGGYSALSADLSAAMSAVSVLPAQQLAGLSPAASQQLQSDRQTVALMEAVSHQALSSTSMRFASLQQLIDAITHAGDQKAALDLQARISAETGMLQNEQTKLQVLHQSLQAEQWANEQRSRERAVVGYGQFATRFQPHP